MQDDINTVLRSEINRLLRSSGPHAIGVCGLGGSGKTSAARHAAFEFPESVLVFETDWYCAQTSAFRREQVLTALDSGDEAALRRWADPTSWYDWERMPGQPRSL